MRVCGLVCVMVLLAGCVSLSSRMQTYMGRQDTELVSKFGAPDRQVMLSDSSRVLTWVSGYCEQSMTFSKAGIAEKWSMTPACPRYVHK
jgi:hypothetical protein